MNNPIIFVHGSFSGGWTFDRFRTPFEAAGYETHAPTLPFHDPGSDLDRLAQCGVKDYAHAIISYAEQLNAPPILVGHSMGGLVAQVAATRMECAALVLLAPSAPWGVVPGTLDEHANAWGVVMLGDFWRRAIQPDYPTARRTTIDRLMREDARQAFAQSVPESGRAIFETIHWALDASMNTAAPPFLIHAPILALAGERDHINSSATVRRIINRYPAKQADFLEMPNMSHWLIGEPEWLEVAQTSLDWLALRGLKPRRAARRRVSSPTSVSASAI